MSPTSDEDLGRNWIVDEVRAVREAIDEEVGHDVAKLAERARRIGEQYRRKHGLRDANLPNSTASADAVR